MWSWTKAAPQWQAIRARIGATVVEALRPDNDLVYRLCRRVVQRHDGDNDMEMGTNGERALMRRVLPSAQVVLDVGANVGDWTATALEVNPDATFHLFEPSPVAFARLSERRYPRSVHLNNLGISDSVGESELMIFGEAFGSNSLYDRRGTEAVALRREAVQLTTLDTYCATHEIASVDFLKIDVEGHELAVLQGARELLRHNRIDVIQFEYGGTYIDARILLRDVWEFVRDCSPDYRFYKLHRDGPRWVPEYRQTYETFQYSNWVIARSQFDPFLTS